MMRAATISLLCAAVAVNASLYHEGKRNHTCAITNDATVLSCSAEANPSDVDTCCVETYGGLVLATQFWDTYTGLESSGQLLPADAWTLHGLWPDFCNGSYTQYCDLNRQYDPHPSPKTQNGQANGTIVPPYNGSGVDTFIEDFGAYDLLAWMNTYWIAQGGPNKYFWAHEFSKHATCFSTFDVPCYGPKYRKHEDVIQFFETAITYYRRLPTWTWLSKAGITPSNSTTYSLSDIQTTLASNFGGIPYVGCSGPRYNTTAAGANSTDNGRTIISEVWYYMHVYGRSQDGDAVPLNASLPNSSCAKAAGAISYPERTPGSVCANSQSFKREL